MINPATLGGALIATTPKRFPGKRQDRLDAPKCDYPKCYEDASHLLKRSDGAYRFFCTEHFELLKDKPNWIQNPSLDKRFREEYFNV